MFHSVAFNRAPVTLRSVTVLWIHSVSFRCFPLRSVVFYYVVFRCAHVAFRFVTFLCVPFRCAPVTLRSFCVAIPLCCVPVPLRCFPLRSFETHSVTFHCVPIALRSCSVAFHSFAFRCAPVALRYVTFLCVPFRCVALPLCCVANIGFNMSICILFANLEALLVKHEFGPAQIYNLDESGISTVQTPYKVIASNGINRLNKSHLLNEAS